MSVELAQECADYLIDLGNCVNVTPVKVTLGNLEFFGARYNQGQGERIRLMGERPESFQRRRKFCFTFGDVEWFISYWSEKGIEFGLCPWTAPNEKIDDYSAHKYLRVPMTVETVG